MRLLKDPKVLKKTGISKSKARRIRTIIRNSIKKGVLLKARMKVLRINAWEQWDRTEVDQDKIISILKKKHALKWQLKLLRVKTRIKIRNMLTETQRQKLKEIGRRRARRFLRGRRGRRGPWTKRTKRTKRRQRIWTRPSLITDYNQNLRFFHN